MSDLIFSLNAVAPLFLVMLLGFILRRRGFIGEDFVEAGIKLCFNVAMPCLLFLNLIQGDITEAFDARFTMYCLGAMCIFVLLLCLLVPRFIKDVHTYSAFIQVSFRSNYVLLGLPLVENLTGQAGVATTSALLAFTIPLFNIIAVLVLSENQGRGQGLGQTFKYIATNPLIIAAILGVSGSLLPITLPYILERPLTYLSDMAMPLGLFTIGASLSLRGERDKMRLAWSSALIKLIIAPVIVVYIGYRLGFSPVQLAVMLAMFAGPPAVSCFPMAHQMGADYQFTSLSIVFSTSLAAFTMFGFVYAFRLLGLV